ncbi:unnamed protein product, partial [Symbiodinium microadriaticum]
VRIVAVMGNWQRVQLLSRRVLSGESITGDHSSNAEVHEALVRLTNEDTAQTIQLVVFQVGSDMALDELLAWRVENGRDKEPLSRKDTPPEKAPVLGSTPRPNYWVLAEFQVDSLSTPVPYDEDEMLKPPPPPPDAIELIRNLEVPCCQPSEEEGDRLRNEVFCCEKRRGCNVRFAGAFPKCSPEPPLQPTRTHTHMHTSRQTGRQTDLHTYRGTCHCNSTRADPRVSRVYAQPENYVAATAWAYMLQ